MKQASFTQPFEIENLPRQERWKTLNGSCFNLTGESEPVYQLVKNSFITAGCLISDEHGLLIDRLHNEHLYWKPTPFPFRQIRSQSERKTEAISRIKKLSEKNRLLFNTKNNPVELAGEFVYLCHPFTWYAYGHLHDSLLRLFQIPQKVLRRCKFAISSPKRINDFSTHLSILCDRDVSEADFVVIKSDLIYRIDRLIVSSSPAMPTNYTPESYSWLTQHYLTRALERLPARYDIDYLYLSRNCVRPGSRGVTNEAQALEWLGKRGTCVTVTGQESLLETIRLFYSANTIIGPHGSLFANSIFCRPESRIIEFCPSNRQDFSFRDKYKACTSYSHILTEADASYNIVIAPRMLSSEIRP